MFGWPYMNAIDNNNNNTNNRNNDKYHVRWNADIHVSNKLRRHTGNCGSSAPHQRITQPTSWPHVASPTWSSTEQVAWPATKRFHPTDWRALEVCCRPWTWWCNDATALAGYATMMMMNKLLLTVNIAIWAVKNSKHEHTQLKHMQCHIFCHSPHASCTTNRLGANRSRPVCLHQYKEHNMHDWNGRTKAQLSTGAHSFLKLAMTFIFYTLAGQTHCSYIQHKA